MGTPVSPEFTDARAVTAILDHHAELRHALDERVDALRTAVHAQASSQRQLAALVDYVEDSVLRHAAAEEATLYPSAAAADAVTALLIEAMITEHRALAERFRVLSTAGSAVVALSAAEGFAAIFAGHVDKENTLLLPVLACSPAVSVAGVLSAMHDHLDGASTAPPRDLPSSGDGDRRPHP